MILFFGYIGPTAGTLIVFLIKAVGWQWAMAIPGMIAVSALTAIVFLMKGTIKPVTKGQSLEPLFCVIKKGRIWLLWLTSSVVFGAYYVLLAQIGQKSITDFSNLSASKAALCITVMTIMVALNNMGVNLMLKLCGNRRKVVASGGIICTLSGGIVGYLAFSGNWGLPGVFAAFFLIALPAGFFPLYSLIAKELAPPEHTGLSVALINFMAFVFIALFQNISGRILQNYTAAQGVFPPEAYGAIFFFIALAALIGVVSSLFVPETRPQNQ